MQFRKQSDMYCDNHMIHKYAMCQNKELLNVTVSGTYW
jgi:hypothetical protein